MPHLKSAHAVLHRHFHQQYALAEQPPVKKYLAHKFEHARDVLNTGREILQHTNQVLQEQLLTRLEIALLLHDIGRFYQHNGKQILTDKQFDHGLSAYRILRREGYTDPHVLLPIRFHNTLRLAPLHHYLDQAPATDIDLAQVMYIAELVRDADKIANLWNLLEGVWQIPLTPAADEIAPQLLIAFTRQEMLRNELTKTTAEKYLGVLSWLFDLNLSASKKLLTEWNFLPRILELCAQQNIVSLQQTEVMMRVAEVLETAEAEPSSMT